LILSKKTDILFIWEMVLKSNQPPAARSCSFVAATDRKGPGSMWDWANLPNLFALLGGTGAGAIAGFASGLLGVSPGGILVPAVCLTLGVDQLVAQGVSLIAQVPPTGLRGISGYRRCGQAVPVKWVALLSSGFIAGGACGAGAAGLLSGQALRWSFVGYLVLLAVLVILSELRSRKRTSTAAAEPAVTPRAAADSSRAYRPACWELAAAWR
jgi:uncharacterized membrane protein YfcA